MKVSTADLLRYFKGDLFANYVGIELLDAHDGWARTRLNITDHHLNGLRLIHGGVLFTLADLAFAAAANSQGRIAVAINVSISFIKATTGKVIFAEARETSGNRKVATYAVQVTDEAGEVLAVFQGLAYRKNQTTDFFETI